MHINNSLKKVSVEVISSLKYNNSYKVIKRQEKEDGKKHITNN